MFGYASDRDGYDGAHLGHPLVEEGPPCILLEEEDDPPTHRGVHTRTLSVSALRIILASLSRSATSTRSPAALSRPATARQ